MIKKLIFFTPHPIWSALSCSEKYQNLFNSISSQYSIFLISDLITSNSVWVHVFQFLLILFTLALDLSRLQASVQSSFLPLPLPHGVGILSLYTLSWHIEKQNSIRPTYQKKGRRVIILLPPFYPYHKNPGH